MQCIFSFLSDSDIPGQFCPGSFQFPGCAKCYGLNNSTTFEDAKRVCSNKSAGSRVVSFLSQHELSDWRNFISSLPITGFKFWVIQSLTTRNGQPGCTVYDSSSRELQRVACSDKHFTACERGEECSVKSCLERFLVLHGTTFSCNFSLQGCLRFRRERLTNL